MSHILGVAGKYSGIGMHLGHYASHFRTTSSSTVSNNQMRRLLHTGIALWLRGFSDSVLRPCCDLSLIGGDGTFIGIPTQNIPHSTQPVWQPQALREPRIEWNRRSRKPLAHGFANAGMNEKEADELVESLKEALSAGNSESTRRAFATSIQATRILHQVSQEIHLEFVRWLQMSPFSQEFGPLRMIFSCLFASESLTGVFPPQLAKYLLLSKAALLDPQSCVDTVSKMSRDYSFKGCGIGSEIIEVFRAQLTTSNCIKGSTVNMLWYFAKNAHDLHNAVGSADLMQSHQNPWCHRPNPATTGIRYFATDHGQSVRNSWPLPQTAISRTNKETSCAGCTKKRPIYIGHRQRTGIWINMCMVHETVVGFHLIHNQEGRRDALIPIYRFWEKPPLAIWNDFGCGCEESGLNWLPEFFHSVQHFHDMFHGYSHTSCSKKFFSRRLPAFSSINTSLMEQVSILLFFSNLRLF